MPSTSSWPSSSQTSAPSPRTMRDELLAGRLGERMEEGCRRATTGGRYRQESHVHSAAEEVRVLQTADEADTAHRPSGASPVRRPTGRIGRLAAAAPLRPGSRMAARALVDRAACVLRRGRAFGVGRRPTRDRRRPPRRPTSCSPCRTSASRWSAPTRSPARRTSPAARRTPASAPTYLDAIDNASDRAGRGRSQLTSAVPMPQALAEANSLLAQLRRADRAGPGEQPPGLPGRRGLPAPGQRAGQQRRPETPDIVSSLRTVEDSQRDQVNDQPRPPRTAPACGCSLTGWVVLAALVLAALWLARRFRRLVNVPLAVGGDRRCSSLLIVGGATQAGSVSDADDAVTGVADHRRPCWRRRAPPASTPARRRR